MALVRRGIQMRLTTCLAAFAAMLTISACSGGTVSQSTKTVMTDLPPMRWDHRPEAENWTEATLVAISTHGATLPQLEPRDITDWCPGYTTATETERKAFWSGLLSSLAKYESTWQPEAAGGGGKWLGLLQIAPATAEGYGCRATTPESLFDGAANLACGVRIIASTVARDGVIADSDGGWRGIAADWTPMRKDEMRADMAAWTRAQPYCRAG